MRSCINVISGPGTLAVRDIGARIVDLKKQSVSHVLIL